MHTVGITDGTASALCATDHKDPPTVTIVHGGGETVKEKEPTYLSDRKGHNGITTDGTATTLTAQEKEHPIVSDYWGEPAKAREEMNAREQHIGNSIVRRLTPLECTRLQGFPDGWVELGDWTDTKGKLHKDADSPKYKALGNSIALPFWEWLARRIAAQYEKPITMGSLFDGIGGFPLAFVKCGGKPRWSSEIEEFPIAVVKKHFGDEEIGIEGDWRNYL